MAQCQEAFNCFAHCPNPPEWEERRLPKQCNSRKKGSLLLTRIRAPAARPTQWYGVREP